MKLDGITLPANLQALVVNRTPEGWQAIASFMSVDKWNVALGADPVQAVRDVLSGQCETCDPRAAMRNMKPSLVTPKPAPAHDLFD